MIENSKRRNRMPVWFFYLCATLIVIGVIITVEGLVAAIIWPPESNQTTAIVTDISDYRGKNGPYKELYFEDASGNAWQYVILAREFDNLQKGGRVELHTRTWYPFGLTTMKRVTSYEKK